MKQLTAIDWLMEELNQNELIRDVIKSDFVRVSFVLDAAKQIERRRIIDAVTYGNRQEAYDGTETIGEKYYKETYE